MRLAPALAAALPLALAAGGCVYLNGLYNAEHAFAAAEQARLAGQDSAARVGYADAERKAERSWRADPQGGWAEPALYLLGRARMRRGDWAGAREALVRVRAGATDPALAAGATLYLGAIAVATGDRDAATALLHEALAALPPGRLRAEGHLWRARLYLSMGVIDQGWWDLERAAVEDPRFRVFTAVERLTWGVVQGDSTRAVYGAEALLLAPEGSQRLDTLAALVRAEGERRGPAAAARMLALAEASEWEPPARDRVLLLRAALHAAAADTAAAVADATAVADAPGSDAGAVASRLFLARLALARADRVESLDEVRGLLVPVVDDAAARRLLEGAGKVALLGERARRGEPLARFAAAEMARDVLGARMLATVLFVEYAEIAPAGPWRGKALLAAMQTAPGAELAEALRARAAVLADDPYVAVAMGGGGDPAVYEALERGLRDALAGLLADVTADLGRRDVLVRAPQDSLSGGLR